MRPEHPSRSRSRSPSSSFGKTSQDYPLAVFDPIENDSESSQFITVGRESSDSARPDQRETTNEPLLPTSTHHPRRIAPEPFSCTLSGIRAWIKGPPYPHRYQITPWLQHWQTAPGRLVERYFPSTRAKVWLLLGCICTWGVIFLSILHSSVAGQQVSGYGVPVKLSCHARLWPNSTDCGLNGDSCRPFDNGAFAFRCPAGCADAMLLEPYFVGPEEYNYRPLVIGGTADGDNTDSIYRGDSAICPAALHAGLIDSQKGGCGVLRRTGERTKFPSVTRNGIESIGYASYFPLSFTFGGESSETSCQDLRWPLFTFSVIVTTLLSLFITSPAAFYASIYFIVYFQVALSSDPPYSPDYYEVVSTALGRFLPCAFVGFAMYYFCVRKTLTDLTAHWDKTVLWLGSCWVGALNTDTFDKIPISRLTPHDIQQQPGAIPALIIIVGLLVAIVLTQAIAFRREGRMPKMLLLYGIMVCGVIALMLVPHMNLRIHHYVLSLLFLPGTTLQTRPSLLYQGLLIGLFINGIARWGFDSILQTSAALLDGAQLGSVLPVIGAPAILSSQNIMFNFNDVDKDADGISVLVNDVERFRAFKSDDGMLESFNWTRHLDGEPEYFRFGYIKVNALGGIWYEDFTRPGTWESEGEWVPPADSDDDSGSVSPSLA
ncbi:LCCL domain-containing protein [Aspergillus neoniger CBS 115656]|uniref:LCCL domain protein n=1 Tax=Aspergillus neoniger (strain CBS 115656) TaxID=1448310 RepID=A0A318YEN4_ASPNB|nr:LCCL domain protein [Aspergillus neoniger CBS 115656]PYH32087.1 LCCL domain protein [Aspergillus neoniger CBS 115656]